MDGTLTVDVAGESVRLLPERAVYWPRKESLFLSDLHLGRVESLQKFGRPVPSGDTEDNFESLNRSLALLSEQGRSNAQQIVIDITDEGSNVDEPTQEELAERFNQTNTTYIAVTPPGDQDPMARYSPSLQKRPLANMTERGVWYNLVAGDFGEQFTEEIVQGVVDVSRENQQELTLDPNETATVTLEVNTTTVPSGTYNVTVATANDTASTTLPIGTP